MPAAVHRYEVADLDLRHRVAALLQIGRSDLAAARHIQRREIEGVPVRVRGLEQWLRISNAPASVVTNRLTTAGLIVKLPSTRDHRERSVRLARQGRERWEASTGDPARASDGWLQKTTVEESRRIAELLDTLTEVLGRTATF